MRRRRAEQRPPAPSSPTATDQLETIRMSALKEQLEALETEHEVLSARVELLTEFLMLAISLLAEEEKREALRNRIERSILVAKKAMLLDNLQDQQNLLRAFEKAMPKAGV